MFVERPNIRTELATETYHGIVIRFYKDSTAGVLALIGLPVVDRVVARNKNLAFIKAKKLMDKHNERYL